MAAAAQASGSSPGQVLHVVADAGYSNGEQAEACEAKGILPHMPVNRGVNNHGDGKLFDRGAFVYQPEQDRFLCTAGQTLKREQISRKDRSVYYAGRPEICGACPLNCRRALWHQWWHEVGFRFSVLLQFLQGLGDLAGLDHLLGRPILKLLSNASQPLAPGHSRRC